MSEPLPSNAEMKKSLEAKLTNGSIANSDRIWDRDEVHEIYKTWREVFNQYDPPLTYVPFFLSHQTSSRADVQSRCRGMGRFRPKTPLRFLIRSRTVLLFRHAHVQLRLQGVQRHNHPITQGRSVCRWIYHMGLLQYVPSFLSR
jgi:hypothetical protein